MQSTFPVWGNGTTDYYMEGPNFPPADPLDANETGNLKEKGRVQGTNLEDLCMWAGEPAGLGNSTDTIQLTATDNFTTTLPYSCVYNPPAMQGPAVICWENNGTYVPTYSNGMQLVFEAQTPNGAGQYVYGDYDMVQTMPSQYVYYYWDSTDKVFLPSSDGLSTKYISNINIYTNQTPWTLQLDGTAIGGLNYTMTESYFQQGLDCHGVTTYASGTAYDKSPDTGNYTYSGMPLWLLCGFVDDQNEMGFNDALAASGYLVRVEDVGNDNYSTTWASTDVARSNNFIIANLVNGAPLSSTAGPLRLVGASVSKSFATKQVAEIQLLPGASWPTLTMGVNGNGTTTPAVGNSAYPGNDTVNISATPASGWEFAGWTGAVGNSTNANTTVTMTGNETVTANFLMTYPVTVNSSPALEGSVSPGSGQYVGPTQFTATSNTGFQFVDWTINAVEGNTTNPLTLNIESATTLTANFTQAAPAQGNASLNVAANVVLPTPTPAPPCLIGISLDRSSIDFGNITPCGNSTSVPVGINNISTGCAGGVNVTAAVQGNATAEDFYGQSLYINGVPYNPSSIIASISSGSSGNVTTQLQVPCSWTTTGNQTATIIFWASSP
jgi:hypothetical protein